MDAHGVNLNQVQQLGEELLKDPRAKDTSHVSAVLNNVNANWKAVEEAHAKRWINPSTTVCRSVIKSNTVVLSCIVAEYI